VLPASDPLRQRFRCELTGRITDIPVMTLDDAGQPHTFDYFELQKVLHMNISKVSISTNKCSEKVQVIFPGEPHKNFLAPPEKYFQLSFGLKGIVGRLRINFIRPAIGIQRALDKAHAAHTSVKSRAVRLMSSVMSRTSPKKAVVPVGSPAPSSKK